MDLTLGFAVACCKFVPVPIEVFDRIYAQYRLEIYKSILRIVGNNAIAEEIVQDTFIRFLEKGDATRPEKHRGFLHLIAHNLAVDCLKKHSRVNNFAEVPERTGSSDIAAEIEAKMLREQLLGKMATENELFIPIFIFRVDYRMQQKEIASALDISERTVMRYLRRIREIIAEVL